MYYSGERVIEALINEFNLLMNEINLELKKIIKKDLYNLNEEELNREILNNLSSNSSNSLTEHNLTLENINNIKKGWLAQLEKLLNKYRHEYLAVSQVNILKKLQNENISRIVDKYEKIKNI